MSTHRPLPVRPNLEHTRKEAKSLLRAMRSGDGAALARAIAVHPQIRGTEQANLKLADAQLVIAREYGFSSWPRLVHYFEDVERQQHAHMQMHGGRPGVEAEARWLLAGHARREWSSARALAAYVPRFFGLALQEVLAGSATEEDARLAIARAHGAPSWTVLLERLEADRRTQPGDWQVDPMPAAGEAIRNADVDALQRVVTEHPELLHPSHFDMSTGRTLMSMALGAERRQGAAMMQPIMSWLTARNFDRQRELNIKLCGHIRMTVEEVHNLIAQGADATWVAPSGIPVLEHALLRYWNGEAVDVIASHTTPRNALWIAAGMGDIDGVRGFLHHDGHPNKKAHRYRPDFVAVGARGFMPQHPDADDEELLLEALLVAMLNGRAKVVEYLAARGAPINSMLYDTSLIHIAVGNGMVAMVECLLKCEADLDLRSASPNMTTRELARYMLEQSPHDSAFQRIAELCGIDPDAVHE